MLDKKEIGKNLERARLKVGLSKGRFAKIAGVDASQYGRVERGEEGLGRENLLSIAEKHGLNVDFLSTGKGPILVKDVGKSITDGGRDVAEVIPELTQAQVISVLASALKDQADAFKAQAELMKSIESKMAQQDSQARIESSLSDVRQVVDKLSEGQNKAANRLLKEIQALRQDRTLSKAGGKKKAGNGAAG